MKDITLGTGIIKVQKTNFKGKDYLDVRKYYQAEGGEYKPTPKGIAIPLELAQEVLNAIKETL